jgi:hypothetical protein
MEGNSKGIFKKERNMGLELFVSQMEAIIKANSRIMK